MRTALPHSLQKDLEWMEENHRHRPALYSANRQIGDAGAEAIAGALATNTTVNSLSLDGNAISERGLKALVTCIQEHKNPIHRLYLALNAVGDAGVKALASAALPELTLLDLSYNSISDKGAIALAEWLSNNDTLTTLKLRGNHIGDKGAKSLARMLQTNRGLETIVLSNNSFSIKGQRALVKVGLGYNHYLKRFHMYPISDAGIKTDIDWYLQLNKAGRRALREDNAHFPWAYFLARFKREPSVLYYFIQAKPELFMKH